MIYEILDVRSSNLEVFLDIRAVHLCIKSLRSWADQI